MSINWEYLGKSALLPNPIPGKEKQPRSVSTWRAKVPGGWLVLTDVFGSGTFPTFYPDPQHEWDGGTL